VITIGPDCMACGQCAEACAYEAIEPVPGQGYARYQVNQQKCMGCEACLDTVDCPGCAITKE